MLLDMKELAEVCLDQFNKSTNMTDVHAALTALVNSDAPFIDNAKDKALRLFYRRWQNEPLVVNQWLALQAACPLPGTLEQVSALAGHEAFDIRNPNKVRSLVGVFSNANPINFHTVTGFGYMFLADKVLELNNMNPQIAARLLAPLTKWHRYDENRQNLMRNQLERIVAEGNLSRDVYEVVTKSLAS
jgi:aminopeptidase N